MADDNNIKKFTAADIEKYHKGLLSAADRHGLEKAALDDPFLADALEGYAIAGVNAGNDLAELKKRLAEKVEGAKVIQLHTGRKNSFRLLRIAAIVVFIAGAGLLIYQLGFNTKSNEIAQAGTAKNEEKKIGDTVKATSAIPATSESTRAAENITGDSKDFTVPDKSTPTTTGAATKPVDNNQVKNAPGETIVVPTKTTTDDAIVMKPIEKLPAVSTPPKSYVERNEKYRVMQKDAEKKELARAEADSKNKLKDKEDFDKAITREQSTQQNSQGVVSSRHADNSQLYNNTNTFRGRVTDADNRGIPFANLTNAQDNNTGTYTDAKGNFNLTHPDTVLTVQVRSVGFENTNVQLRNDVPNNQVILQNDRRGVSEVVVTQQKPNAAARQRNDNTKLDEPEPADGWENYDTYLVNNLNKPADFTSKPNNSGTVEISFEVDKNGKPSQIKVEKSLCTLCDKEAIRLVKDGPKWKRKVKQSRATVTIYF